MILGGVLDLVFPRLCIGCKTPGGYLCAQCASTIPRYSQAITELTDGTLTKLIIPCVYENPLLERAIHLLKYQNIRQLAPPLAMLWSDISWPELPTEQAIIIPTPSSKRRVRMRGYNQAELLGRELSHYLNIPLHRDILLKCKHTAAQMTLERDDRVNNLRHAFQCNHPEKLQDQLILLVDDVCTTGATLTECAKALRINGAREVWGIALARGM